MSRKCYFCGPDWFKRWMRKPISGAFNGACRVHDMDYSARSPYNRVEADVRFYLNMWKRTNGKISLKALALFLFVMVRLFGDPNFRKARK